MGLNLKFSSGQTPLDEDEIDDLLIPTIATRGELDEFEQQNIEDAMLWVFNKTTKTEKVLTEKFICDLHKRMLGNVWNWAGKFRKPNKNLGIDKWQISTSLKSLCDDTYFWITNETYSPDEIALRFKHRIVSIHCFSNGNGRHSRLMADILINKVFKLPLFSWGTAGLIPEENIRDSYLKALKAADMEDFSLLLIFARA